MTKSSHSSFFFRNSFNVLCGRAAQCDSLFVPPQENVLTGSCLGIFKLLLLHSETRAPYLFRNGVEERDRSVTFWLFGPCATRPANPSLHLPQTLVAKEAGLSEDIGAPFVSPPKRFNTIKESPNNDWRASREPAQVDWLFKATVEN